MMYSDSLKREYTADELALYEDMKAEALEVILHPDIRLEIGATSQDEVFAGLQASFGFAEGTVREAIAKDVAAVVTQEFNEATGYADLDSTTI